jgi:hypothetical protein
MTPIINLRTGMENNEHLRGQNINIKEERELMYWSYKLECEKADIVQAVMKIGTCAKMVDDFLTMNRKKISSDGQ